ncbi:VOC family protein [Pseudanabaenaceae cyanobacterium LEGE 13415]|nr:VOC family protein [Pseudanabaenaceae cyanobacterium LEGE 13415]
MGIQFRHIMLMVEDVLSTATFFHQSLGLPIKIATSSWAELEADGTIIALHSTSEKPLLISSPILSFHVADIYTTIEDLEAMGAKLEGSVRQPAFGKVASIRTPDGHLLSLLQPVDDRQLKALLQRTPELENDSTKKATHS